MSIYKQYWGDAGPEQSLVMLAKQTVRILMKCHNMQHFICIFTDKRPFKESLVYKELNTEPDKSDLTRGVNLTWVFIYIHF